MPFRRAEPHTILVNLQTANGLSSDEVGTDDELVEGLHATPLKHDKLLDAVLVLIHSLVVTLRIDGFKLLHALLDLL